MNVDLSDDEVSVVAAILRRATSQMECRPVPTYPRDPIVQVMLDHTPVGHDPAWGCTCANGMSYVSKPHLLVTHIRPLVERAATQKIREILARSGMDLDVIIQSDKIFGE